MPFTKFDDLTKKSSDLLGDDFDTNVSAKIKAKNNNLTWAAKATNKKGSVGSSLEGTYKANGTKVVGKFEAGSKEKVTWKVSNEGLVEGVKLYGDTSYDTDYSGKIGATVTQDLFTADVSLKGCKDTKLNFNVVGGVDQFAVGANVTYVVHTPKEETDDAKVEDDKAADGDAKAAEETEAKPAEEAKATEGEEAKEENADEKKEEEEDSENKDLVDMDFRVAYEANDAQAVVVLENKMKVVGLEVFYEMNESTKFAAKWGWEYGADENAHAIEFGAQHQLDEDTVVKGKISAEQLNLAVINNLNKNIVLKLAAQTDITNIQEPASNKIGLAMEFSN